MPTTWRITEPHPTPASHYLYSGRGGAGNYTTVNPSTITHGATASGPASATTLRPSTAPYFAAGRGGAGNMHLEKERRLFSFDEELERQRKMMDHHTPYYHIGRGGAGNLVDDAEPRRNTSHSSADSTRSSGSVRNSMEAGLYKIRATFGRS